VTPYEINLILNDNGIGDQLYDKTDNTDIFPPVEPDAVLTSLALFYLKLKKTLSSASIIQDIIS